MTLALLELPVEAECEPCRRRGRPNVKATHPVNGEGFCDSCFMGRPQRPRRGGPRLDTQVDPSLTDPRGLAILDDYKIGVPVKEICQTRRCGRQTIMRLARASGTPLRSELRPPVDDIGLVGDYLGGSKYSTLMAKYGIRCTSIVRRLRQAGVEPNRKRG